MESLLGVDVGQRLRQLQPVPQSELVEKALPPRPKDPVHLALTVDSEEELTAAAAQPPPPGERADQDQDFRTAGPRDPGGGRGGSIERGLTPSRRSSSSSAKTERASMCEVRKVLTEMIYFNRPAEDDILRGLGVPGVNDIKRFLTPQGENRPVLFCDV